MIPRHVALTVFLLAAAGARTFGQSNRPPDGLDLRFADGIVAIAEDKVITVDDVRRQIQPLLPQLQREARSEEELNQKLEQLQDNVIQELIDKVLIIKDFHKDEKKHIPDSIIETRISEILTEQFDGDRSKFLGYLRSRGQTLKDYHTEVEEDIIYTYMQQQQRKSETVVSPVRIEQFYKENKDQFYQEDSVHLRLIELSRASGMSDGALEAKADIILARFHAGEKMADLAREFSEDTKRTKGGDWGWQKRTGLLPEFADPLFALKKGEATEPILTKDGCFILYVDDRKYAGIQPLDQVRGQIERLLISQMTELNMQHWLERLRRNGYVKHF